MMSPKIVPCDVIEKRTRVVSREGDKLQIVLNKVYGGSETLHLVRDKSGKWFDKDGWNWLFPTHPGVAEKVAS